MPLRKLLTKPVGTALLLPVALLSIGAAPQASTTLSPLPSPGLVSHRPAPPAAGHHRCVKVAHMAGAVVIGDRAVELTMVNGRRWRMAFARDCPALSFYQGFYYRRAEQGELCAGRDAVVARSGGECPIASIIGMTPVPRR